MKASEILNILSIPKRRRLIRDAGFFNCEYFFVAYKSDPNAIRDAFFGGDGDDGRIL